MNQKVKFAIAIDNGVRYEVQNPSDKLPATSDQQDNELSVVLRITYGDLSHLLTGDASQSIEQELLAVSSLASETHALLSAVVYKAGHHGARSSSNKILIDAGKPQYVVISAGEDNRFGHPHEETLYRFADLGAAVLPTDELGTIEVITDGEQMWWEVRD